MKVTPLLFLCLVIAAYGADYPFTPTTAAQLQTFAASGTMLNGGDTVTLAAGDYNYNTQGPAGYGIALWFKNRHSGTNPTVPVTIRGDPTGARPVIHITQLTYGLLIQDTKVNKWKLQYLKIVGVNDGNIASAGHVYACFYSKVLGDLEIDDVIFDSCGNGVTTHDTESGNILIRNSEVVNCGADATEHGIYASRGLTDSKSFSLINTYVHNILGGNAVKSRFPVTKLYYNYVDYGAADGRPVELISADCVPNGAGCLAAPTTYQADVVGNVIINSNGAFGLMRIGRDIIQSVSLGKPPSYGKYRFVSNTFSGPTATQAAVVWGVVKSIEAYNNIFNLPKGTAATLFSLTSGTEAAGTYFGTLPTLSGSNNWVTTGVSLKVGTASFSSTFAATGTSPGFGTTYALSSTSPCLAKALTVIPTALTSAETPVGQPPRAVKATTLQVRSSITSLGCYEYASASNPPPVSPPPSNPPPSNPPPTNPPPVSPPPSNPPPSNPPPTNPPPVSPPPSNPPPSNPPPVSPPPSTGKVYSYTPATAATLIKDAYSGTMMYDGGDTIMLGAGTYTYSAAGPGGWGVALWFKNRASGKNPTIPITITGDPAGARPVIQFSNVDIGFLLQDQNVKYILKYVQLKGVNNGDPAAAGHVGTCYHNKVMGDVVLDDVILDSCGNGILTNDIEGGSITVQNSEVVNCGAGTYEHGLYASRGLTDSAVFTLKNTYIHNILGGNGVKSRFPVSRIYNNYIDYSAADGRPLELISADCMPNGVDCLTTPTTFEADVVGNVIVNSNANPYGWMRIGRDTTGLVADGKPPSNGKYRFAYNTFSGAQVVEGISVWGVVKSIEAYNNIFDLPKGSTAKVFSLTSGTESAGTYFGTIPALSGSNNWVTTGAALKLGTASLPTTFATAGSSPGFTSSSVLTLSASSPCLALATTTVPATALASTVSVPLYLPSKARTTSAAPRGSAKSAGAYEYGLSAVAQTSENSAQTLAQPTTDLGLIVGCSVGAVVLVAIIIAAIYAIKTRPASERV